MNTRGVLAALLMSAIANRRDGECFCGECEMDSKTLTIEEALAKALTRVKAERAGTDIVISLLENPIRNGRHLVDVQSGVIIFKTEASFHTFAAYGSTDDSDDDYTVVYMDSRKDSEQVYNVHGMDAVQAIIDSIRGRLQDEFRQLAEAETEKGDTPT